SKKCSARHHSSTGTSAPRLWRANTLSLQFRRESAGGWRSLWSFCRYLAPSFSVRLASDTTYPPHVSDQSPLFIEPEILLVPNAALAGLPHRRRIGVAPIEVFVETRDEVRLGDVGDRHHQLVVHEVHRLVVVLAGGDVTPFAPELGPGVRHGLLGS